MSPSPRVLKLADFYDKEFLEFLAILEAGQVNKTKETAAGAASAKSVVEAGQAKQTEETAAGAACANSALEAGQAKQTEEAQKKLEAHKPAEEEEPPRSQGSLSATTLPWTPPEGQQDAEQGSQ